MAPSHDPTKEPKGDDPFLFTDENDKQWMWDFNKSTWFEYLEDSDTIDSNKKRKNPLESKGEPPKKKQNTRKDAPKPSSVYVENLPSDCTLEELVTFFSRAGIIKRDEFTGEYKVKMYNDEDGQFKGDALITYFQPDSVPLALTVLDGADIRYKCPLKVTEAKFEASSGKGGKRKNKKKAPGKKQKIRYDQSKDLSWDEENRVYVVMKGLFEPKEAWTDLDFAKDLKADVKEECENFGPVELVGVFENNPEGVVTVKFKEPLAAAACIEKMNGRYFAGKQISADYYDGFTNYKVEESEEQRKLREAAWSKFIEGDEEDEEN